MSKLKNKIKRTIQDGYSSKKNAKETLRKVYEIVDTEEEEEEEDEEEYEEEEEEEEEYDEEEDEAEGYEDEEDEEDDEDGGGFFNTILDLLPDEE